MVRSSKVYTTEIPESTRSSVIEVSASKDDLGGESIGLFLLLTPKAILF